MASIAVEVNGKVSIDFPALNALVDYLVSVQQGKIDALTAQVKDLTSGLAKSGADLETSVSQGQ